MPPKRKTPSTRKAASATVRNIKVGDVIVFDGPANLVQLPDGTVVTARDRYTVRHEGEHQAGDVKFTGIKA